MLATIDVTLRKPRPNEEYQEVLDECRTTGLQMSQLVERMLALARLDAGADHLRAQEVDVARLADQCSAMVRPLAEARGLHMNVAHAGPALIKADPDKIREILTNLLHNAIEYNKPEGNIDVSVQRINGYLEMQVRDTGIGIAPEAQQHVFERFFRADSSRHAEGVHAGIGLALVKGYVDLMGGRISLQSAEGAGTTFTIQLPAGENGES
jgi:signal transduction histidine kinase